MKYILAGLIVLYSIAFGFSQHGPGSGSKGGHDSSNMPKEGVITGKVIDNDTKTPVQYANIVLLQNKDSSVVHGTIADELGVTKYLHCRMQMQI